MSAAYTRHDLLKAGDEHALEIRREQVPQASRQRELRRVAEQLERAEWRLDAQRRMSAHPLIGVQLSFSVSRRDRTA